MKGILRSAPEIDDSIDPLLVSLRATIGWCLPRIRANDPERCLRSEERRPRVLERDYFSAVGHSLRVGLPVPAEAPALGQLAGGRLLAYYPEQELADGAAQHQTKGFLDVNNCPPWDTWVAIVEEESSQGDPCLVAWIPPEFVAAVESGIAVNPEECIRWLSVAKSRCARLFSKAEGPHNPPLQQTGFARS